MVETIVFFLVGLSWGLVLLDWIQNTPARPRLVSHVLKIAVGLSLLALVISIA